MMPDYAALADLVRTWAAQAGVMVDAVNLSYHGRPVVVLPLPPGFAQAPGGPDDPPAEKGRTIPPVVLDILQVLRDAGKPLTTFRVLEAMARHKPPMEWSKTSVENYLAAMVKDGTLVNPEDARPRGYRLPADEEPA